MTNHLILLITLFIIAIVHSAIANYCEGQYTTDLLDLIDEVANDRSYYVRGPEVLKHVSLVNGEPFKDICSSCDLDEKLSICMKVLQHKLKKLKPVSFTVDSTESTCECAYTVFTGIVGHWNHIQKMYVCPATTVTYYKRVGGKESSFKEPSFLISQGLHSTQYRVRFLRSPFGENPASILGQLTGFKLNALNFEKTPNGHYTYLPDYSHQDYEKNKSVCEITLFRPTGRMADYKLEWEDTPEHLRKYCE